MTFRPSWKPVVGLALLALVAGCGSAPSASLGKNTLATSVVAQAVPPASAFVTVEAQVTEILPDDTSGLPHQNFKVKVTKAGAEPAGEILAVNNDTKYGTKVQGLAVGARIVIKGVPYHDAKADGIHWTHHANKAFDAGWIQDASGTVFQ